jgi:fluoroquinolone transport system permease protein
MTRLLAAMKTDVMVQNRNHLYGIGIGIALLSGYIVSQITTAAALPTMIPIIMLFVVGGSTLLYVAGLLIFEKDEGTLSALIVSPLRRGEYLWSKIITLSFLATLESAILLGLSVYVMSLSQAVAAFNIPLLFLGIIVMAVLYTLLGIILIVRYKQITDFLVPVLVLALVLQAPFLYFAGLIENPLFLIIPTSAPTMLMQAAWINLELWQWVYALGYSAVQLFGLTLWAFRAFDTHIVKKVG